MANRVRSIYYGSLILLLALAGSTTVIWAQGVPKPPAALTASAATGAAAAPPAGAAVDLEPGSVRLMVGRSTILNVGTPITRVSLTSADVADAMVTSPGQLLINGKLPGTISMFVWDKAGTLKRYEVQVQRDLTRLSDQMNELFPNEHINVHSNGRNVVLSGSVSKKDLIDKAVNVASGYVDKKEEVTTLLQVSGGAPTQVLLKVRFAEVSRSAMTDLGASFFTSPNGYKDYLGRVTTQQYSAPIFDNEGDTPKLKFSDFLNFFLFSQKDDLGVVIKALQQRGLFQSLAEPNLVAESGKEASFLAGGEFPVPVVQGSGAALAINVVFKEFGIRLNFTPEVIEDRIHLKVRPEVSTLDFANAVSLQGFRIPALSTRRTEAELELKNHQTFAISGLMNNTVASTMAKVPGIGDIPILGYLFRSKAAQKDQTELVVMITPEILAPESVGVTPNLPRGPEKFLEPVPDKDLKPLPPPAFESERRGASLQAPAPSATVAQDQSQKADQAAAAVSALAPSTTRRMAEPTAPKAAQTPAAAPKPLSDSEKKALERAQKADVEHQKEQARVDAKNKADEQKRMAEQAAADKRAAELQKEKDAKAAREQAKRDAEAQKKAEEDARRELIRQREQQRQLDEAAAQLKEAQDRYDAVAKTPKQ